MDPKTITRADLTATFRTDEDGREVVDVFAQARAWPLDRLDSLLTELKLEIRRRIGAIAGPREHGILEE